MADSLLDGMEKALSEDHPPLTYGNPTHKQVYCYGFLQMGATPLNRSYGMAWGVGGWLMPNWYGSGKGDQEAAKKEFVKGVHDVFKTEYAHRISLEAHTHTHNHK
jgi:hypothetical protein